MVIVLELALAHFNKKGTKMYYVVTYNGHFGFIKPWTAVRDGETFSQQFLTPSIIEGMRQKLEVEAIPRHRLTYSGISIQQEVTQTRGWQHKKKDKVFLRPRSILNRGVLLSPTLYLAFGKEAEARKAATQHLCLCRNEDVMLPDEEIKFLTKAEFNNIDGFELRFGISENSFLVGYDRFNMGKPMFGWLESTENPLKHNAEI